MSTDDKPRDEAELAVHLQRLLDHVFPGPQLEAEAIAIEDMFDRLTAENKRLRTALKDALFDYEMAEKTGGGLNMKMGEHIREALEGGE